MAIFRGVVRAGSEGPTLESGGLRVSLEGDSASFAAIDGKTAAVSGRQVGDVIRGAKLLPEQEAVRQARSEQIDLLVQAVRRNSDRFVAIPGVVGIRPGMRREEGVLTRRPAIVAVVAPGADPALPNSIDGFKLERCTATPNEMLSGLLPLQAWSGVVTEAAVKPQIRYVPPSSPELRETEVGRITCHVGPDSGWSTLKPFLAGTSESLTVAMFDFYADHIVQAVNSLGAESDATLAMILQLTRNKDDDIEETLRESWGSRLDFVPALVSGPSRIFNNAYHTKVAVRDHNAFWLSSGNWTPTSQPEVQPTPGMAMYAKGNREWHVIVEDEPLARVFEEFIRYDINSAREGALAEGVEMLPDLLVPEATFMEAAAVLQDQPFYKREFATNGERVCVMPLMSPDNYAPRVLELIRSAQRSLYLQFSYIRQPSYDGFDQIIRAIAEKMEGGVDVRILVGSTQEPEHSELLIARQGWKPEMLRRQRSKVHNKGIVVDGKVAVVGSNNWSNDGTQYNRDASLVIYSRPIAQYYTDVFLFDWENLSRPIGDEPEVVPIVAGEGPTPHGMVRIPWQAWYSE